MNYDNSLVVTITVTCYSWAPSSGDHLFTYGAIYRPPDIYPNCFNLHNTHQKSNCQASFLRFEKQNNWKTI